MRGAALDAHFRSLAPEMRDAAVTAWLGVARSAGERGELDALAEASDLVGHHASDVDAIRALVATVPIREDDVFVDLGAGSGKVVLLVQLLTGATCIGIELQAKLVAEARLAATRLALPATFVQGDVRAAPLGDGNVFFLYAPFTGAVLEAVLARLRAVASVRPIVVATLGLDLRAPWLVPRPIDAFWLAIYEASPASVCATDAI